MMNRMKCFPRTAVLVLVGTSLLSGAGEFPKLTGPYLGQKPPGTAPEVFAPGIVSTETHEFSCAFSPDGKEFYFSRRDPVRKDTLIFMTRLVDGAWTEPRPAPFADNSFSFEPWLTPDNQRLYFQSGKPVPGQAGPPMNVLYVEREGEGWSTPKNPGSPFNPARAMHISSTLDGTIYTTDISAGPGSEAVAVIPRSGEGYGEMKRLGPPVNVGAQTLHAYIAPDESFLIYASVRPNERPKSDLYLSHRKPDGSWGDPRLIELGRDAGIPCLSPDGKYLFFTSGERGRSDVYWVSAEVIKKSE